MIRQLTLLGGFLLFWPCRWPWPEFLSSCTPLDWCGAMPRRSYMQPLLGAWVVAYEQQTPRNMVSMGLDAVMAFGALLRLLVDKL